MKILHIIHTNQFRGAEVFTKTLSRWQIDLGHQVDVVEVHTSDKEKKLEFPGSQFFSLGGNGKIVDLKATKKLGQIIKEGNYDIVQANSGNTLKYAVLSKWFFGWKPAIVFRNASVMSDYFKSAAVRKFYTILVRGCRGIASVSGKSKADFLRTFPSFSGIVEVLPVGIDFDRLPQARKTPQGSEFQIVHVGGFSFEKNHEGLIRIFSEVKRRIPNAVLNLVGDGPLKEATIQLVENAGLRDAVVFHGFVGNPLDYIRDADVLVLPSVIEGLPSVILEAFALGVPVVANDVGGISEIVKDRITGRLIDKNNEKDFAKAIIEIAIGSASDTSGTAYELVSKEFNNREIAMAFEKFYHRILNLKS